MTGPHTSACTSASGTPSYSDNKMSTSSGTSSYHTPSGVATFFGPTGAPRAVHVIQTDADHWEALVNLVNVAEVLCLSTLDDTPEIQELRSALSALRRTKT